jgi:hypothetical protein
VAAILDPRIKVENIEPSHSSGDAILAKMQHFVRKHYLAAKPREYPESTDPATRVLIRQLRRIHAKNPPMSDIDRYFDSEICVWDGRDDREWVLRWWRMNAADYPIVARVARDYLAVLAAEVRVEGLLGERFNVMDLRESGLPI